MKNAITGGFLSLIGSIWALAVLFIAGNNLTNGWSTPPGRLMTTVSELGMTPIFAISILTVVTGLLRLLREAFRKE